MKSHYNAIVIILIRKNNNLQEVEVEGENVHV